jgi:hypothetical protein
VFVREDEEAMYREALSNTTMHHVIAVVPNDTSISTKRHLIFDRAAREGKEHVFILDDDSLFFYRDETMASKYCGRYEDIMLRDTISSILIECILSCDEQYPITGLPLKQSSNNAKYAFEKNKQMIHFQCYHVPTLLKENIRHDGLGVHGMSDRWVQLSLLSRGYRSLTNCRYAIDDMGTGKPGGSTLWRTVDTVNLAANTLYAKFPNVVALTTKENGLWNELRTECRIHLKEFLSDDEEIFVSLDEMRNKFEKEGLKI